MFWSLVFSSTTETLEGFSQCSLVRDIFTGGIRMAVSWNQRPGFQALPFLLLTV
jgi:hypothetical protein